MRLGSLITHRGLRPTHFLPALVLGWSDDVSGPGVPWALDDGGAREPPWLVRFDHQYGGHACLQVELGGLVMPLRWRPEAEGLVETLEAIGEEGPPPAGPRMLYPISCTFGQPYRRAELDLLARALRFVPALPGLVGGCEAFVDLDDHDVGRLLAGWPVLGGPHLTAQGGGRDGIATCDLDGARPYATLDEALVAELRAYAPGLPLRLLLAWLNSD